MQTEGDREPPPHKNPPLHTAGRGIHEQFKDEVLPDNKLKNICYICDLKIIARLGTNNL